MLIIETHVEHKFICVIPNKAQEDSVRQKKSVIEFSM